MLCSLFPQKEHVITLLIWIVFTFVLAYRDNPLRSLWIIALSALLGVLIFKIDNIKLLVLGYFIFLLTTSLIVVISTQNKVIKRRFIVIIGVGFLLLFVFLFSAFLK